MNESSGTPQPPIASEKLVIERKIFYLDLKENARGRFLKITEDVGGRRDTIVLPVEAAREFLEAMTRIADFEAKLREEGAQ
jgi:PurA ssDNA and RNA-binding protein